MSFRAS
jgi:hypothetical protein